MQCFLFGIHSFLVLIVVTTSFCHRCLFLAWGFVACLLHTCIHLPDIALPIDLYLINWSYFILKLPLLYNIRHFILSEFIPFILIFVRNMLSQFFILFNVFVLLFTIFL